MLPHQQNIIKLMLLTEIPNYIQCKKISNLKNISFNKVYTNSCYITKSSVFIIEKKTRLKKKYIFMTT